MKHWTLATGLLALLLGIAVSVPHWLHVFDDRYQGVSVHLNSDEHLYLARVQQVLCCGTEEVGTAVGGGEHLPALQSGLLEQVYGVAFWPFADHAATIFTMMDFVVPVLLFLVIVGFARSAGFSRKQAVVVAVLFSLLELYNLGRPIHQRASFLLTLLSMWTLVLALEKSVRWSVVSGVLLGLLVSVYFWSWTAAWAWWGVVGLYYLVRQDWRSLTLVAGTGLVGIVVAAPQFWQMAQTSLHPVYDDVFFRSGIAHTRLPETWVWSGLFTIMAAGAVVHLYKHRSANPYVPLLILAAAGLLNQMFGHGIRFVFASHYLFLLVLAAVCAVVYFWRRWTVFAGGAFAAAALFLAGIAVDNQSVIHQWRVDASDFAEQHLAAALPVLSELDRSVVLSDPDTSAFVASHTKHDVLYTAYLQHELRTHQEIAERYCLTQALLAPEQRDYDRQRVLVYGAAYDAFDDPAERQELRDTELALVETVCEQVEEDLAGLFERYGIGYVLHDLARKPNWNLSRLPGELTEAARSKGWVLYRINRPGGA